MKRIGIMNGPNMDRLGVREVHLYGDNTLKVLEDQLREEAEKLSVEVLFYQSNHEGALIDKIGEWADEGLDGVVINPAAYTHTSVALGDAIAGSGLSVVEVHISNIYAREEYRQKSMTAPACVAVISGLGIEGYHAAMRFLA